MKAAHATGLAICLYSSVVSAEFFDGNDLFDMCKRTPLGIDGYVAGSYDTTLYDQGIIEVWQSADEQEPDCKG